MSKRSSKLRVKFKARDEKAHHDAHPPTFMLVLTNVNPHSLIPKAEEKKYKLP